MRTSLAIALVIVTAVCVGAQTNNLTRGKHATQSSNYRSNIGLAASAIDGNTDGNFSRGSVTHTTEGPNGGTANPWWQVDLGKDYLINAVRVYNRTDCCQERLNNFQILVRASASANWSPFSGINSYREGQGLAQRFLGNATARYVRVQLTTSRGILSLAEVQVFGVETNAAAPRPTPTPSRRPSPEVISGPLEALTAKALSDAQHNSIFGRTSTPISTPERLYTNRFLNPDLSGGNLGNHTQGFAILPNNYWAISYSQNWLDESAPAKRIGEFVDFVTSAKARDYSKLSSLLISGGSNHLRINHVPARNSIELSGLASVGNVIAAAWSDETRFYYWDPVRYTMDAESNFKLNSGNFVGFTKFNGYFYCVTGDDHKQGQLYRTNVSVSGYSWGDPVSRGNNPESNNFNDRYRNKFFEWTTDERPKTKTGALAMFSGGGKLYLGLMEYEVTGELDKARNYVRILEVNHPLGTPSYTIKRQFEVPSDRAFDGPNFRWGGTMHINSRGELEIYSIARVFEGGPNGSLRVLKHTFR